MIQCQFFPILNSLKMNMNRCIWFTMEFLSFQYLVARKQWNQMIRFHLDWDLSRRILLSRRTLQTSESENDSLVSMRSKEEENVGDMKYMNVNFFRSEFWRPKIQQRMVKLAFPFGLMTPISIILAILPDMELIFSEKVAEWRGCRFWCGWASLRTGSQTSSCHL